MNDVICKINKKKLTPQSLTFTLQKYLLFVSLHCLKRIEEDTARNARYISSITVKSFEMSKPKAFYPCPGKHTFKFH